MKELINITQYPWPPCSLSRPKKTFPPPSTVIKTIAQQVGQGSLLDSKNLRHVTNPSPPGKT